MSKDTNQTGAETGKHPDHFVAEWRTYRGYGVRELARELNIQHTRIVRVEAGETELRPRFAKKLADFFNIPFMALFVVNPQTDPQSAEMLDVWADIPASKREDVLRMMRALRPPTDNDKAG